MQAECLNVPGVRYSNKPRSDTHCITELWVEIECVHPLPQVGSLAAASAPHPVGMLPSQLRSLFVVVLLNSKLNCYLWC